MKLNEVYQKIELTCLNHLDEHRDVESVYIGDLLSFVMANGKENCLWLTVQRHMNVIAVAQLNDFAGIIFVQGVEPDQDVIDKATELEISLFTTSLDSYQLARLLSQLGL